MDKTFEHMMNSSIDESEFNLLDIKIAFLNYISLAERNLYKLIGKGFKEDINESEFNCLKSAFDGLSIFTLDEINKFKHVLGDLRDNQAHYLKNRISKFDLKEGYLSKLSHSHNFSHFIVVNRSLTYFGFCLFISMFLDLKNIDLLTKSLIVISKNRRVNKSYLEYARNRVKDDLFTVSRPIYKTQVSSEGIKAENFSLKIREKVICILLTFEKILGLKYEKNNTYRPHDLNDLLMMDSVFKRYDKDIQNIQFLRNAIYHGQMLNDKVLFDGRIEKFNLSFIGKIIGSLKQIIMINGIDTPYAELLKEIDDFAKFILNYKVGRVIEIAYKMQEVALFSKEKIKTRVENSTFQLKVVLNDSDSFITNYDVEKILPLLLSSKIKLVYNHNKFADVHDRKFCNEKIHILHYKSSENIAINDVEIGYNDFYTIDVNVIDENKHPYFRESNIQKKEILPNSSLLFDVTDIYTINSK